jgi:hypothetical protein
MIRLVAATAAFALALPARLPAQPQEAAKQAQAPQPPTKPEATGYKETSRATDVAQFLQALGALPHRERLTVSVAGKTTEGRELQLVRVALPDSKPESLLRVLVVANIHAGEVEGKEAMQSLLRDLLFEKNKNVLDSIVLIVQPIYNADGNEKWGPQARNRGAQNGPEMVGTRQNASGWNLNRDYIGADAPETKGAFAMLNKWDPDLFMDLHTTDGSIHGYALTYAPPLTPTAVNVLPYSTKMLADIRQRMLDRHGFYVQDYGDFSRPGAARGGGGGGRRGAPPAGAAPGDTGGRGGAARGGGGFGGGRGPSLEAMIADSIPSSGWAFSTYESLARYGTNYYGLRNRLSVLSEAFSHDPFARRVASTYDFVSELLSYLAEHKREILALEAKGDANVAAWARQTAGAPQLSLKSRMDTTRIEDVRVEQIVPLTDSTKREAGLGGARQRTGIIKLVRMPVMASFTPTLTSTLPFAYAFDTAAARVLLPILAVHGIAVERLDAPASVTAQSFAVDSVIERGRSETSRMLKDVTGKWSAPATRSLRAGSYVVRAGQPRGLAAFYLLEPESEDGLAQWSIFDGVLAAHSDFPVARVVKPATFRSKAARN